MIFLDELLDYKLYKKEAILPINKKDKKLGNVCVLLTPNVESSQKIINNPLLNSRYYESYYIEKDISMYINESGYLDRVNYKDYVHIDKELILEGIFYKGKRGKIIFNGYKEDVDVTMNFINQDKIDNLSSKLHTKIKFPLSITVVSKSNIQEIVKPGMIQMRSRSCFDTDEDYMQYCDEILYTLIIISKNPNINPALADCYAMVFSGTYSKYRDLLVDRSPGKALICEYIYNQVRKNEWGNINSDIAKGNTELIKSIAVEKSGKSLLPSEFNIEEFAIYESYKKSKDAEYSMASSRSRMEMIHKSSSKRAIDRGNDDENIKTPTGDNTSFTVPTSNSVSSEATLQEGYRRSSDGYFTATSDSDMDKEMIHKSADKSHVENDDEDIETPDEKDAKTIVKQDTKSISSEASILESKHKKEYDAQFGIDAAKKLSRHIKYKSNKGSKHILNKVDKVIDKTVDPDEKVPDLIGDTDDPNISQVEAPSLGDVKAKVKSTTGQAGSSEIKSQIGNNSKSSEESESKEDEDTSLDEAYKFFIDKESSITESYIQSGNTITFFDEATKSDPMLYKLLYKERLKKNRDVIALYDMIKEKNPKIKYTFLTYRLYKRKNLFIDLSYYNNAYFSNTTFSKKKGYDLYMGLLSRMIKKDPRLEEAGYDGKRTIIIPIHDWDIDPKTKMWIYNKSINPLAIIYELIRSNIEMAKEIFGDSDIVFLGDTRYFKINFSKESKEKMPAMKFITLLTKLRNKEPITDDDIRLDSKEAIVDTIVNKIEDTKGINVAQSAATGKTDNSTSKEVMDAIEKAAEDSNSTQEAIDKLNDNDYFKEMIMDLEEEKRGVELTDSRVKRINTLDKSIREKKIKGKTIGDILEERDKKADTPLETTSLKKINSINPEWQELKYAGMHKQYDMNADIMATLVRLSKLSYPISILDIDIQDTSTAEDYINTYTVKLENHNGKRFSIKFDIPIMVNDQYMVLRGNKKSMSAQSFLMPLVKTDPDTAQVVSNYNKIFIRTSSSLTGKSNIIADRVIKTLKKADGNLPNLKIDWQDCSASNINSSLPIDFIDFSTVIKTIELKDTVICFDIGEIKKIFSDKELDFKIGIPYGWRKSKKEIMYYDHRKDIITFAGYIYSILHNEYESAWTDIARSVNASTRYCYSKASILNTDIPVIIICAYSEGLVTTLNKAKIEYTFLQKKPSDSKTSIVYDYIKFSDGFLQYTITPESSLLLNGLRECSTELYTIAEMENRTTYLELLDNYGGRLKADGLDNFYDCMIGLDPITIEVLAHYNLPEDYVSCLIYASNLLADTDYFSHGQQSCRRIRKNEIIVGYFIKILSLAYGAYSLSLKHGRDVPLSIKQSAVIDAILLDPTAADLSIINALNEFESYNQVSTKGLSGMNNDRSYSLDKRSYDDSMTNILSMSTGFATTVGINRQATLNAKIDTTRGYIQPSSIDECNSVNTLCMSEALTPMGTTRDDPFRSAMTFIQTSRHGMIVEKADPLLVTNGADEALAMMVSDIFAHKAKGKGVVAEFVPDDYMIIKYENAPSEYIQLGSKTEKNSSTGKYVELKMKTSLKKGSTVKEGDIVAYDSGTFVDTAGFTNNLSYKIGTLAKGAIMVTDEGFEDSCMVSEAISEALASNVIKKKEINLDKNSNVYNLIKVGTPIEEGDTLLVTQTAFDEEDANMLLKNLAGTEEEISDLGRRHIKASVTGWIQDIEILRTVDMEELSPSLQKICKAYESKIRQKKTLAKKYNIEGTDRIGSDDKLPPTGRLKNTTGVKIIIYMGYHDKYSIGDKLVYWSANKGVCKDIFPKGDEPYALDRPNEKLHYLTAIDSINGRMVCSIFNIGIINRLLIEASRKAKDMAGIKYDENLL